MQLDPELRSVLDKYVREKLARPYKDGQIDKESYKRILKTTLDSVARREGAAFAPGTSPAEFMNDKRRAKIKELIGNLMKKARAGGAGAKII